MSVAIRVTSTNGTTRTFTLQDGQKLPPIALSAGDRVVIDDQNSPGVSVMMDGDNVALNWADNQPAVSFENLALYLQQESGSQIEVTAEKSGATTTISNLEELLAGFSTAAGGPGGDAGGSGMLTNSGAVDETGLTAGGGTPLDVGQMTFGRLVGELPITPVEENLQAADDTSGTVAVAVATTSTEVGEVQGGIQAGTYAGVFEDGQPNQHIGDTSTTPASINVQFTPADNEVINSVTLSGLPTTGHLTVNGHDVAIAADGTATFSPLSGIEVGEILFTPDNNNSDVDFTLTVSLDISDPDTNVPATISTTAEVVVDAAADQASVDLSNLGVGGQAVDSTVQIDGSGEHTLGWMHFTVNQAGEVTLDAHSSQIDTYVYILRDDGTVTADDIIGRDDDSGPGLDSHLVLNLQPGNYIAVVGDYYLSPEEVVAGFNEHESAGSATLTLTGPVSITSYSDNFGDAHVVNYLEDNAAPAGEDGSYVDHTPAYAIGFEANANDRDGSEEITQVKVTVSGLQNGPSGGEGNDMVFAEAVQNPGGASVLWNGQEIVDGHTIQVSAEVWHAAAGGAAAYTSTETISVEVGIVHGENGDIQLTFTPVDANGDPLSSDADSGTQVLSLDLTQAPQAEGGEGNYEVLADGNDGNGHGLEVELPQHSDDDFHVEVSVTTGETNLTGGELTTANNEATSTTGFNVVVDAVADRPEIAAGDASYNEDNATQADGQYTDGAAVFAIGFTAGEVDRDGSEELTSVTVSLNGLLNPLSGGEGNDMPGGDDVMFAAGPQPSGETTVLWDGSEIQDGDTISVLAQILDTETGQTYQDMVDVTVSFQGDTLTFTPVDAAQDNGIQVLSLDFTRSNDEGGHGLEVELPQNSDDDFSVTVSVTSTETNPVDGDPITGNDSATSTTTFEVHVNAVADAATDLGGGDGGNEDTSITPTFNATFADSDGSESHILYVTVPDGWTVTNANGWTLETSGEYAGQYSLDVTADGTDVSVNGPVMTPPLNSDVDREVTLTAVSSEDHADGDVASAVATSSTTVTIGVDAVADAGTGLGGAGSGNEDTSITPTYNATFADNDGSESHVLYVTVPDGWTVTNANGWTLETTGDYAGQYSLEVTDKGANVSVSGPAMLPPLNSDLDGHVTLTTLSIEDNAENGVAVLTATSSTDLTIGVNAVPDAATALGGSGQGNEDTSITPTYTATFADNDGSETHILSVDVPAGWTVINANGWTLDTTGGEIHYRLDVTAQGADVSVAGPTMLPPHDSAVDASVRLDAITFENGVASYFTDLIRSATIHVAPVADAPTLAVGPDVTVNEADCGTKVVDLHVNAGLVDTDGSETLSTVLTFTFDHGTDGDSITPAYTVTGAHANGDGTWTVDDPASLKLVIQEANWDGTVQVAATATSIDHDDTTPATDTASTSDSYTITVDSTPDVTGDSVVAVDETNLPGHTDIAASSTVAVTFEEDFQGAQVNGIANGGPTGLATHGQPVTVTIDGDGNYVGTTADHTVVFTLTFDATGAGYTYTQYQALDHANPGDPNDNLALNFQFVATDSDGDPVNGTITVNVSDDGPTADVSTSGATSIAEDAEGTLSGTWTAPLGADHDGGSITFEVAGQSQTLGAIPLTFTVANAGVLTINPDGSWSLDPASGSNANGVSLSVKVTATDADGDTASDSLTLTVTDGTGPGTSNGEGNPAVATVDEDGSAPTSGTVSFTQGSDAITSVAYGNHVGDTLALTGAAGSEVVTVLSINGNQMVVGDNTGNEVTLTLTSNAAHTSVTVSAALGSGDAFSHLAGNGETALTVGGIQVVASDVDGDTTTAYVAVNVVDDLPGADIAASGATSIVEDAAGTLNGTWTAPLGADGAGSIVFEVNGSSQTLGSSPVTFHVANAGDLTINPNGTWSLDPTGDTADVAAITVKVTATDSDGDVATDTLSLTVTDASEVVANNDTASASAGAFTSHVDTEHGHQTTTTTHTETVPGSTTTLFDFESVSSMAWGNTSVGGLAPLNTSNGFMRSYSDSTNNNSNSSSHNEAYMNGHALVIEDEWSGDGSARQVASAAFSVAAGQSIRIDASTHDYDSSEDSFSWTLYQKVGSNWVNTGVTGNLSDTTAENLAAGTYRLVFSLDDSSHNWDTAQVIIDTIYLVNPDTTVTTTTLGVAAEDVSAPDVSFATAAVVTGNVITDAGAGHDDPGSEGATVTLAESTPSNTNSHGVVTYEGDYGTLTFYTEAYDGHDAGYYTYKAYDDSLAGGTETVHYTLTQADGDTSSATLTIDLAPATLDGHALVASSTGTNGTDYLVGTTGSDDMHGGAGNDYLFGGAGNDQLSGESDNDYLNGGAGDDTLYGGAGGDNLIGGEGNDVLYGQAGNDVIRGGNGADTIHGGAGDDVLYGGAGNDTFVLQRGDLTNDGGTPSTDTIKDFANGDVLDLSDVVDFYAGNTTTPASAEITLVQNGSDVNVNSIATGQTIVVIESESTGNLQLDDQGNITAKS